MNVIDVFIFKNYNYHKRSHYLALQVDVPFSLCQQWFTAFEHREILPELFHRMKADRIVVAALAVNRDYSPNKSFYRLEGGMAKVTILLSR